MKSRSYFRKQRTDRSQSDLITSASKTVCALVARNERAATLSYFPRRASRRALVLTGSADLMLKKDKFSALAQCDDWIHLAGAPRGKIARNQCDCQEHKRRSDEARQDHVITACPLSVWVKQFTRRSPRQNRRHAAQSLRNVSRTGLRPDFFL